MRKLGPVAAGGFYLTNGLPDEYYALTGGELSLTVERGGGINTLGVLDVLECRGKYYPDRSMTPPVIQREGQRCGLRPLYGPGVQFISTNTLADGRMGRNLFHVPDVLELYPFGFYGESTRFGQRTGYDLCIDGRTVFFRFDNAFPTREQFIVCLNKAHLVSGRLGSLKNQIAAAFDAWTRPEMGLPAPDPSQPFADNGAALCAGRRSGWMRRPAACCWKARWLSRYGTTPLAVMLLANRPFALRETGQRYLLSVPWEKEGESDEVRWRCCSPAVARRRWSGAGDARARRAADGGEDRARGGLCRGGACAGDCPLPAACRVCARHPGVRRGDAAGGDPVRSLPARQRRINSVTSPCGTSFTR